MEVQLDPNTNFYFVSYLWKNYYYRTIIMQISVFFLQIFI